MSIKRLAISYYLLAFVASAFFVLLLVVINVRDLNKKMSREMDFLLNSLGFHIEHEAEDSAEKLRILEGLNGALYKIIESADVCEDREVFYYADISGKIISISGAKYKPLKGLYVSNFKDSGIDYSSILDTIVVRSVREIKGSGFVVYEEAMDEEHPIRKFIDKTISSIPREFSLLIVDSGGRLVQFGKEWQYMIGRRINLGSVESYLFGFDTVDLAGEKYIVKFASVAGFDWKIFVMYPVSAYWNRILRIIISLGFPVLVFSAFMIVAFGRLMRLIVSDVNSMVGMVVTGDVSGKERLSFKESKTIMNNIAQAQRELYKSKWFLSTLLKSTKKAIIVFDDKGRPLFSSKAAVFLLGSENAEEILRLNPWIKELMEETLAKDREISYGKNMVEVVRPDGARLERIVNIRAYPYQVEDISGCVVEIEDITEEVATQNQLMIAQRMESLGLLAGGIAHDFNNILNVIIGYAQLIKEGKDYDPDHVKRLVGIIEEQSFKAAELIRQLLDFARASSSEKQVFDMKPFLKEFIKFIGRTFPKDIRIIYQDSGDGSYPVYGSASRLQQVFLNLAVNARDAMPSGGELRFTLRKEREGERSFVVVEVSDTGVGIEPDHLEKIFDPFFTTKGEKGTGLGLSQVYGIVKEHGGTVKVESKVGKGTKFTIYLPEATSEDESKGKFREEKPDKKVAIGRGSVVVVEDNVQLAKLIRDYLSARGYDVKVCSTVKEGIEALSQVGDDLSLVVADLFLPDGRGSSLVERALRMYPKAKAVIISGRADELMKLELIGVSDRVVFLPKPFNLSDLQDLL